MRGVTGGGSSATSASRSLGVFSSAAGCLAPVRIGAAPLQQAQLEERNQMAIRHKDDMKKFNMQCEVRRTALVSKQEEDRKAMFAMRRQTVAAAEKKGESVKV